MEIFRMLQQMLAKLGIYRPQSFEEFDRFNVKNSFYLVSLILFFASTLYYLLEIESFSVEFTDTCFGMFVSGAIAGLYATIIWTKRQLFKTITQFEKMIEMR